MRDVQLERVYARWCARSVLHLWDAPEVVRRWVDEGEEALREEAGDAAGEAEEALKEEAWGGLDSDDGAEVDTLWVASWAADATAWAAEENLSLEEAKAAAEGAFVWASSSFWLEMTTDARDANRLIDRLTEIGVRLPPSAPLVLSAPKAARDRSARQAKKNAVRATAEAKQQRTRDLLTLLPDLLRTHGLSARLLDEAREDAWLTREVVRALGLPDLAVWCDWCAAMENNQ